MRVMEIWAQSRGTHVVPAEKPARQMLLLGDKRVQRKQNKTKY